MINPCFPNLDVPEALVRLPVSSKLIVDLEASNPFPLEAKSHISVASNPVLGLYPKSVTTAEPST